MKVLLVNPPAEREYIRVERCMQVKDSWGSLWQPIQLCYAQSVLKKQGYETKLVDCIAENMDFDKLETKIKDFSPDTVVINTALPTLKSDLKVAEITGARTAAIGISGILVLEMMKNVDAVIQGDVEKSVLDFCRGGKGVIKNQTVNLDGIPFPDFSDLNLDRYTMPFSKRRMALIVPSRGCPFRCSFCLVPLYHKKATFRSAENIVDEIEVNSKKYDIKDYLFWSETFTLNKDFVLSVCGEIIKRKLSINWMTPSRSDRVDEEILKSMKNAGCDMISYGVECLNQEGLDGIRKEETVEDTEMSIKMTKAAGIKVIAHVIVGLPGETEEMFKSTINRLIELKTDYVQIYCATPYPGTGLYKTARKNNWIKETDLLNYQINKSAMRNEHMTAERIQELRRWGMKKFYLRPKFMVKETFRNNPKNLFSTGIKFIFNW